MTRDEAQNLLEVLAGFTDSFNRLMSADALLSEEQDKRELRRAVAGMFGILYGQIEVEIYRQFPDLAPDREGHLSSQPAVAEAHEGPIITSDMTEALGEIILETCRQKFLKTARIVVDVCTDGRTDVQPDDVHQVIIAMCEEGLLEHQGNIHEMRFSEIRRPAT